MNVNDILGLGKMTDKLLNTIGKGLGWYLEPKQIIRKAKATKKAYELLHDVKQNHNFLVSVKSEDIAVEEILPDINQGLIEKEIIQNYQALEIVEKALSMIDIKQPVSDKEIDEQWIDRYFDSIKKITNEEVKVIWAKILADTVTEKKEYSIRTLDFLRSLSNAEALVFTKLEGLAFKQGRELLLPNFEEFNNKYSIRKQDLWLLEELGILKEGLILTIPQEKGIYIYENSVVIVSPKNGKDEKLNIYKFTNMGIELYNLLGGNRKVNINEYCTFVFKRKGDVKVGKITSISYDMAHHEPLIEI
ncbi:MAG: DUF2806 domain-containing protein [Bacilli bacterium]|nr:DUF2806 domain-containing protein [Bacilli bacterium]